MRIRRALVVLPVAAVAFVPADAGAAPHGFAQVRLTECVTALEQEQRSATFEGEMRGVRGSARLQMRFSLYARASGRMPWARLAAPKFDTWLTSDPGRKGYVYIKRVDNLLAPSDYRAVVRFRWLDAAGHVIATARRTSRACHQPDARPDLRVLDVHAMVGSTPDLRRYIVAIRNAGQTAAGPFAVAFALPNGAAQSSPVAGLGAGERVLVDFEAPACAPGSAVVVTVDADEQVDEAFETDDTVSLTCPEPG